MQENYHKRQKVLILGLKPFGVAPGPQSRQILKCKYNTIYYYNNKF